MKKLFTILMFFLISVALSAQEPFRIIGYVPGWIDVETFAKGFDYSKVTHLNYAFQNPDASGNLASGNNGLKLLVEKAHQNKVKVLVSMGGGSAAGDPVKANYQSQITTPEKRAAFISKILVYLEQYNLDGFDVDEEGPAINQDYEPFVRQLADSLKPKGLLLTAAVGWGGESIPNTAFQYFDFINLMSYDLTGSWNPDKPGQHSPYWYAQQMILDYKNRGVKKEQICLGLPFYGYGFYSQTGDFPYNKILQKYPDAWKSDQVGDTIFYNGVNTIRRKTELALAEASGVMIWELSTDGVGEKSLLNAIAFVVDSGQTTNQKKPVTSFQSVRIYPNPVQDRLIIENQKSDRKMVIQIYSEQGKLVKTAHFRRKQVSRMDIDVSGFARGTYICKIADSGFSQSLKFVKN